VTTACGQTPKAETNKKNYIKKKCILTCKNRTSLQAAFPAFQATVMRHTMSVSTLINPTLRSATTTTNTITKE
jgi:hypothetical protein